MTHIFLSYSRTDRQAAAALAQSLAGMTFEVWWDRDLEAGAGFTHQIDRKIRDAASVIVLWSEAAVESDWVIAEATLARDLGKLLPARISPCNPKGVFYALQTLDLYWDSAGGRFDAAAIESLIAALGDVRSPGARPARTSADFTSSELSAEPANLLVMRALRQRPLASLLTSSSMADQWLYATALSLGMGIGKSPDKSRVIFESLAKRGFSRALNSLGIGLITGEYGAPQIEEGVKLVRQASDAGVAIAQCNLGLWLLKGTHMPADPSAGFQLLQQAALAGNVLAEENVAWCYYRGTGTLQDPIEARYWFERAAAKGHGAAMCMIGALHADGVLADSSDQKALDLFRAAYASGYKPAAMHIGALRSAPDHNVLDMADAISWFRKAGEDGDAEGYLRHAELIMEGEGKFDRLGDVRYALAMAADMGSANALLRLGLLLEAGRYGPVDRSGAREALKEALGREGLTPDLRGEGEAHLRRLERSGC